MTRRDAQQDELNGVVEAWRHAVAMGLEAPQDELVGLRAVTLADVALAAKAIAARETLQVIISGEKAMAEATAQSNQLGALKIPQLRRVEPD